MVQTEAVTIKSVTFLYVIYFDKYKYKYYVIPKISYTYVGYPSEKVKDKFVYA